MSTITKNNIPANESAAIFPGGGLLLDEGRRWRYPKLNRLFYFFVCLVFRLALPLPSASAGGFPNDTVVTTTQRQAIAFIDSIHDLKPSIHWPYIQPALFIRNLKTLIEQPISVYPGNGTNFCGYGAITYLMLRNDPLGFARLLLQLYLKGEAQYGDTRLRPSPAVKQAASQLRFKGKLDIRPAEQLWYLCLADRFKGYLNWLNRRYDPGDEDRLWAAVNYAKFNRMARKLLRYKVKAKGGDLFRPRLKAPEDYIREKMNSGTVVLYINNRMMRKKNHATIKLGVPTHYIVVEKIMKSEGLVTLVYWDYGGKTLLQLSPFFLKRILYGITHCTPTNTDVK